MHLYDTATRRTVDYGPAAGRTGIYVCGITPYDGGHLGHAFTYHTFDVLARRLRSLGTDVRMVRNVTDVDDDMMRISQARGIDYLELGNAVVDAFERDMAAIGIAPVDAMPRATQHVPAMVSQIARLEEEGAAYAVDGWVFFDVSAFSRYGDLSRLSVDEMVALSRERGANPDDPRKRNPLDFVLWQPSLPHEPSWPSFWSDGRPGWHIECSVLSALELGLPIDIHGGGDDLIYPHHESEIAQSEAAGTREFCRLWMHVAMVAYDGEKMSKSLGNLVFVRELIDRGVPAAAIRLLLGAQHYRSGWTYDEELLLAAGSRHASFVDAIAQGGPLEPDEADDYRAAFFERIDDDLDVPGALAVLDIAAVAALHTGRMGGNPAGVSGPELLTELLAIAGVTVAGTTGVPTPVQSTR